jgi:putative DNA primase/helicase
MEISMRNEKSDQTPTKATTRQQQRRSRGSRAASNSHHVVEVVAWVGTPGQKNWGLLLKFKDRAGHRQTVRLPASKIRNQARLLEFLDDHGVPVPADPTELVRYIQGAQPERCDRLVTRPGWHGDKFLLGGNTVGKGKERLRLDDRLDAHLAQVATEGSLDDWKVNIADRCTASSYLVFGLAIGFAAPLLRLTDVDSGGFHFWVRSTRGKTTVQRCAASIFGKGQLGGDGYLRSWKTTSTAMEEAALGHCDLPLILDELKLLDSDKRKAAQLASDAAYSIANETIKARSAGWTGRIPADARHFRTLIVSSGEISLGKDALAGGMNQLDGEAVRLIDIPVPECATGILDRLPEELPGRECKAFIRTLKENALQYYGTAGNAFIRKLVEQFNENQAEFKAFLKLTIEKFLTKSAVDQEDPYEARFAERFGLAYAAALLAIDYEVVSWDRALVYRSIRRVYRRALHQRTGQSDPVQAVATKILQKACKAKFVDIRRKSPPVDPKTAEKADVLLITHSDGSSLYALRPDFFKSIVGPRISSKKVAKYLDRRDILIPRSKTCRTQQVRIPGLKARRGYYCLTEAAVAGKSSPKPKKP